MNAGIILFAAARAPHPGPARGRAGERGVRLALSGVRRLARASSGRRYRIWSRS